MRSAWSNDFLGLTVATGFVLNLFLASNILLWTGHRTASWATLGAGFGVYSLVQLYYAFWTEERGSRARGTRVISFVFTAGFGAGLCRGADNRLGVRVQHRDRVGGRGGGGGDSVRGGIEERAAAGSE